MIKISDAATLGFHAVYLIVGEPRDTLLSVATIARRLSVSEAHLGKVLQRLSRLGLVNSRRGPKGGFGPGPRGAKLSVLEIYEAIDGPIPQETCLLHHEHCPIGGCLLGPFLERISKQVRQHFADTTFEDLIAQREACLQEGGNCATCGSTDPCSLMA